MNNPYQPPQAAVADIAFSGENNSGGGKDITLPDGVKGWSILAAILIPVLAGLGRGA